MRPQFNLPVTEIKLKDDLIWDRLRKKFLKQTPEEWVRQSFISYMIDYLGFPEGRMASEYLVKYNKMNKRCDIVVFDKSLSASVIVECKAPKIKITEDTFYQIAKYAHVLKAKYLILTNGMEHYCALIDSENNSIKYLEEIPKYSAIAID